MSRKAKELGALAVSRLTEPGLHAVGGVAGLALQISETGGRSWILRYNVGTKRRALGLGGYPDVTLAGAREAAREARSKVGCGTDPIEERKAVRAELVAAQAKIVTFKTCAETYIATIEREFRNPKHRQQWKNTLAKYAYPKIGNMIVGEVGLTDVVKVLEPIWHSRTETARRLRGRIERVLDWATGRQLRTGDNPARWKGALQAQLAAPGKIAKVIHHPALSLLAMPTFMERLREAQGTGARALEFLILTAARSGEVRGMTHEEIDLESKVWTVPSDRMKAGKEHKVPLSAPALDLLKSLPQGVRSSFVFSVPRGGQLSDMTLTAVMRRLGETVTVHGFRSTFRDWAATETDYPREAAEFALAHGLRDKVEAAYYRNNLLEKRRLMMADWASFCGKAPSTVIPMRTRQASA